MLRRLLNPPQTSTADRVDQFPTQAVNLILHCQIFCLVELPRQRVHSNFEQNADRVTDAGESHAKHLLLAFTVTGAVCRFAQDMIAKLWNSHVGRMYGSKKSSAALTSGVLTSRFLHSKTVASSMARACRTVMARGEFTWIARLNPCVKRRQLGLIR
jgi:hypothetical protein